MLAALLGWIFETLWHALVGLVVLSGLFAGSVMVIAREIERSNRHDQATCGCTGCTGRRNRAWRRRYDRSPEPPGESEGSWVSTLDLNPFDRVEARGIVYQVLSVESTGRGRRVRLRSNRRVSIVPISHENISRRFWHVIG